MKFKNENWPIKKLVELIEQKKINLSPKYQRNDIWSIQMQMELMNSIKHGWPLPNFFVLEKKHQYEMIDGQQRARAILSYIKGDISDEKGNKFDEDKSFLNYALNVTVIMEIDPVSERVEDYYTLVNSKGLRINRPELFKAKYYNTRLLSLVQKLAQHETFNNIGMFTPSTVNRMNDVDFVSELVVGIEYGITDKKLKVDELFENDIDEEKAHKLEKKFNRILKIFNVLNDEYPLRATRYKQRNDFYTLFLLFKNLVSEDLSILKYFYYVLRTIDKYISPSKEECEILNRYAINCVTQSNSKTARSERERILIAILMNDNDKANESQEDILAFFNLSSSATHKIGEYLTLDCALIEEAELEM